MSSLSGTRKPKEVPSFEVQQRLIQEIPDLVQAVRRQMRHVSETTSALIQGLDQQQERPSSMESSVAEQTQIMQQMLRVMREQLTESKVTNVLLAELVGIHDMQDQSTRNERDAASDLAHSNAYRRVRNRA